MGSTNKTAHYELPQFVANDKPSWLGDVNQAMEAIDTGIFGAKSSADGAQTTANNAVAGVQTANTRMDGMQTQLDTVATQANQTATAVNQHTASIATNSANINTLNSRMGSTDISEIGDGTVTGAIQAISEGGGGGGASNVRWNATTDRFEVLKNGNWVQSIRAFVNRLAVWVAGVFGIPMSNGVYHATAGDTLYQFTIANDTISATASTNNKKTLVSDGAIDFSNYSKIKVTSTAGNITVNIPSGTTNAFLYLLLTGTSLQAGVSSVKENFQTNAIIHAELQVTTGIDVNVTEIVVE